MAVKHKNNVTRLLASRKIAHTVHMLPDDEQHSAVEAAALLGVDPGIVYKTIVITRPTPRSKPLLVMVPGMAAVELRVLAKALEEKKLTLPTQREAEQITGLQAGGISALALLNKGFDVYLDEHAKAHAKIHVSGGQRRLSIRISPDDLLELTRARWVTAF